jgi:hypothetical protein
MAANPCETLAATMESEMDREWACCREMIQESRPAELSRLAAALDPRRSLVDLREYDKPLVAFLAHLALRHITASVLRELGGSDEGAAS